MEAPKTLAEVYAMLDRYNVAEYAPPYAEARLLSDYYMTHRDDIMSLNADKYAEFVEALRYRYGACVNLARSRAIHPKKLDG